MRATVRHWTVALLAALLVHAGLFGAILSAPPTQGARAAGVGGIEVGLGPAGGAPGAVATEAADVPEAETEVGAGSAGEPAPPETAEAVEAPDPVETSPPALEPGSRAPVAATEEARETDPTPTPPSAELAETAPETEPPLAEPAVIEPLPVETTLAAPVAEPLPAELAEAVPIEEALAAAAPPRSKPERPQPKTVQSKPAPTPRKAAKPEPAEAKPAPSAAAAVAKEAGATEPSETRTGAVAPSAAGAGGKAGTQAIPDAGEGDGTAGGGTRALQVAYGARLRAWLQKHKKYPRRAKMRNQQGTPVVRIRIDRDGMVLVSDIDRPSGHRLLDREALETIARAEPMPKPPAELQGEALSFLVPLDFVLY